MNIRISQMIIFATAAVLMSGIATVALADTIVNFGVGIDLDLEAITIINFEIGLGLDSEPIGNKIPGFLFSTTDGGDLYLADINTGYYSVTSDNGKVYEDGSYFVSGDVAVYAANLTDKGKISFTYGPASRFSIGYSSEFDFSLEAYDSAGVLLASDTKPANTKGQGGTELKYVSVDTGMPNIAYVVLHDEGGYWMIDNITTDAVVPEPSSIMLGFAVIAAGIMRIRRKEKSSV